MRQRDSKAPQSAEETVRDIRRATRRQFSMPMSGRPNAPKEVIVNEDAGAAMRVTHTFHLGHNERLLPPLHADADGRLIEHVDLIPYQRLGGSE